MQSPTSYGLYLGATDNEVEGIWKWESTGAVLDYFNWSIENPNNYYVQNCLMIWKNISQWDDMWCNRTGAILETLCEIPFDCPF